MLRFQKYSARLRDNSVRKHLSASQTTTPRHYPYEGRALGATQTQSATCSNTDQPSRLKSSVLTTPQIQPLAAPILRRRPPPLSVRLGREAPTSSDSADSRAILALLAEPRPEPVARSLTGLAVEVRAEFALAQRMRNWGR